MPQYETVLEETERIAVISGLTNDGIAYLRFSSFMFSHYLTLTEEDLLEMEMEGYEYDASNIRRLISTWKLWFDSIQELHGAGKLKGIIIDVRGNNGGLNNDNRYVVGALLPSGGHKVGTYKMKTAPGRLDYSIDFDYNIPTMDDEHAIIDDVPIVALCDHASVSNAEMTSIAVKQLPNGYVVGSQTHGGMSSLITGWSTYSYTYSGEFGVSGSTPIYGYQPISMINYTGYGVLEGIGVTPDYSLEYDPVKVADPTNPSIIYTVDNQLEAALKYIRRN